MSREFDMLSLKEERVAKTLITIISGFKETNEFIPVSKISACLKYKRDTVSRYFKSLEELKLIESRINEINKAKEARPTSKASSMSKSDIVTTLIAIRKEEEIQPLLQSPLQQSDEIRDVDKLDMIANALSAVIQYLEKQTETSNNINAIMLRLQAFQTLLERQLEYMSNIMDILSNPEYK